MAIDLSSVPGDEITAILEWLGLDATIAAEFADRLFGHELPDDEAKHMPRTALVVSNAGGFGEGLPDVLDRSRVDVRIYARTLDEAKALAWHVSRRFTELRRFVAANGVVLHPAKRSGGYIPLREQVGGWPLILRSWLLVFDVRAAA